MKQTANSNRRGYVLLIVTVTVVLLSLAAYTYTGTMTVEYDAAVMHARDARARMMAESAIEYAAIKIAEHTADPSTVNLFHDSGTFRGQFIEEDPIARGQVRFSVVTPSAEAVAPRFGLSSENGRFNINRIVEFDQDEDETTDPYTALSYLPGMTEDIANAILDWIDSDDVRRTGGAETDDYKLLAVPYEARNAPLESIDELLQIQGVTPQLFYGEDANRNGILDPNENDGDATPPLDNQDGYLDLGWRDYLTVSSREVNTMPDGAERINLNQGLMTELFDALEPEFGEDVAKFVVAYRLYGNENADPATMESLTVAQKDAAEAIGKAIAGGVEGTVTRAGLDLTQVPQYSFRSIYDLIDAQVPAVVDGADVTLNSPWTSGGADLLQNMPQLEQMLTHVDDAYLDGRVNVNEASFEVLMALPGMTEVLADAVVAARPPVIEDGVSEAIMTTRISPTWLLAEGIVDLETLKLLGPWLTTGGDVYRFQTIGHFDQGGPTIRLEAMIDGTQNPPQLIFVRDLTPLGRGFHPAQLSNSSTSTLTVR
ncbi:MAG: general secretion pathway protein GspK [Planctomycetaceae bacterium]|nr:general secretion pathway protein GspK [Planctomycetaceae bacterium]